MDVYFVTTGLREELQVIKQLHPPRLLCSYWYFKNKPLAKFCEELGYRPEILLDSGAYSAYTKGKNVNLLDYLAYIKANKSYISRYIALDVIGDHQTTRLLYYLMKSMGLDPVPVIHYGDDLEMITDYMTSGAKLIALGATVRIRDKREVARWCAKVKQKYQEVDLHLLGSCSPVLLQNGALKSCDASSWYIQAVNGKPSTIPGKTREAKIARAEANMRRTMEVFDENPIFSINRGLQHTDSYV